MPPNLSRMPAEVLLGIFSLLKPADNDNLQLTCRRVNKVILENPGPLPVREIDLEFSLPSFDFTAVDHAVRRVEPLMLKFKQLAALMAGRVSVKSATLAMDDGGMDRFAFSYLASSLRKYRDQFKGAAVKVNMCVSMPYPWPILFEAFSGCSSFACSFRGLLRPSLSEMLDAGIPLTVCNGLDVQNIAGVPTDTLIDWLISPEKQDRSLTIDAVDEPVTALLKRLIERRS